MSDQSKNIEILQTQVDQVKTELDLLKKNTSEKIKKDKAEAAAEKVKTTKVEITKRLQELKDLGEENNQAEIQRLHLLLANLESVDSEITTLQYEIVKKEEKKNEEMKKIDEEQKIEEQKKLEEQKTLDAEADENKTTTSDGSKKKNRFTKQREAFSDKTEENHTRKNVGRVALGVGAGVLVRKGIKWLFGIGKHKENAAEGDSEKKEKKTSRWKKALLRGGGIIGGIAIRKHRDQIKNRLGFGDKDKKPENPEIHGEFDDLPENIQKKYYAFSDDVDAFTKLSFAGNAVPVFSDDAKTDKKQKAEITFGLNKDAKNLKELFSHETVEYVKDETTDGILMNVLSRGSEKIKNILGPYLLRLASFASFAPDFVKDPIKAISSRANGGMDRKTELSLFYKEYMNVLYFASEKTKIIKEKAAKEEVMGKGKSNATPSDSQQEKIDTLLHDEAWTNRFLQSYNLADIPELLQRYAVGAQEVSEETKETIDKLHKDNAEVLQTDEDGKTVFDRASEDFVVGKLENETKDELIETCQDLLDLGFGTPTKMGFIEAYTHLITDIFKDDTQTAEYFMKMVDVDQLMGNVRSVLTENIQKIKNGTFTSQDLVKLKKVSTEYLAIKDKYALQMEKTYKEMDQGIHVDGWKILELPRNALKDIGKLFSSGPESRREKTGRGFGGFLVEGGVLYVTGMAISLRSRIGAPMVIGGKYCRKIGKLPLTLSEKAVKLALGRTFLTGRGWERFIIENMDTGIFSIPESEDLLKYAFVNGEISEKKALEIVHRLNLSSGGRIKSIAEVMKRRGLTDDQIKTFLEYKESKYLRKLMFSNGRYPTSLLKRPGEFVKYNITHRTLRNQIVFDTKTMDRITAIDIHIKGCKSVTEQKIRASMMRTTKDIDQAEKLVTMGIPPQYLKYFEKGGDMLMMPENFGKYLSKYGKSINAEKMDPFIKFLVDAKQANKIAKGANNIFVANALKNAGELEKSGYNVENIEKMELNTSRLDKRIAAMKENFKKSVGTMRKLIKEKKTPYPSSVESAAEKLDDLAAASNEDISLLAESERIGTGSWISSMSRNPELLKELSPLFDDDVFLKELGKAKTPEAVKSLFRSKGVNEVPEEFVQTLSKTSSTKKLADTMRYVQRYDSLKKIGKILQNPTMKYAGRVLGRTLGVATVGFGIFEAYSAYEEGAQIKLTNEMRGEIKETESIADLALTAAGACAFIPGIGWVASGAIIAVTAIATEAKEVIYDTLDKYTKNSKDFLYSTPLLIKEHILTTTLGAAGEDRGFGDRLVQSGGVLPETTSIIKYLAAKTGSEAIKGLLYVEEWKKYPLASINIDDADLMAKLAQGNPPITRAQVAEAKDMVDKNVAIRYTYLQKKCGIYLFEGKPYINIKKFITVDKIKSGEGMKVLDQLLLESGYALDAPERFGDPKKMTQEQEKEKTIIDRDKQKFAALEKIFASDRQSLLYMYRYLNEYKAHLAQYGFDDAGKCIEPAYDAIIKNMEYFDAYMSYKMVDSGIDVAAFSASFNEPNFIVTRDFFATLSLAAPVANKELYRSSSKLQTILYRIAVEVIGARLENNTMKDIKEVFSETNEKTYGLYFNDDKLDINGRMIDNEYTGNDVSTIKSIRAEIQKEMDDGDLIDIGTGDTYLNQEIGKKYLRIIDEELARP